MLCLEHKPGGVRVRIRKATWRALESCAKEFGLHPAARGETSAISATDAQIILGAACRLGGLKAASVKEGDWSGSRSTSLSGSGEHSDRKNRGAEDRTDFRAIWEPR